MNPSVVKPAQGQLSSFRILKFIAFQSPSVGRSWRTCLSGANLIIIMWSILSIEMTLKYNAVSNINAVSSTGQLIPLIIGIVNLLKVINAAFVSSLTPAAELIIQEARDAWTNIIRNIKARTLKSSRAPGRDLRKERSQPKELRQSLYQYKAPLRRRSLGGSLAQVRAELAAEKLYRKIAEDAA